MNKIIKNTIIIIGILLCAIVLILNICVSSTISNSLEEKVEVSINSPIKFIIAVTIIVLGYLIINKLNKINISKKRKNIIFDSFIYNIYIRANSMDKCKKSNSII